MSWLDTFKNDERSLYWLVKYIHHNDLFYVNNFPTNIEQVREIIQKWESEFINGVSERSKHQLSHLMKSYFANVLPIESFDWLSVKNPKQLSWVLFYINLNPIPQIHFAPQNKYYRSFASNIEEAYPLIIKTFDAAMTHDGHKQNYLLALKCAYSQYVIGKSPLPWLDMKDEETCSWVWRYLVEKVEEASKQQDVFQFIKPIDNETVYWSCIALIGNWELLKNRYVENIDKPLFDHIKTIKPSNTTSVNLETNKSLPTEYFLTTPDLGCKYQIKFHAADFTINQLTTTPSTCLITLNFDKLTSTDIRFLTITAPSTSLVAFKTIVNVRVNLLPNCTFTYITEKLNQPSALDDSLEINGTRPVSVDLLPAQKNLIAYLYNAHKQKIHRQRNNSLLGLNKANQKKLTNYAKEQNTTEKKALNEIVKAMLD